MKIKHPSIEWSSKKDKETKLKQIHTDKNQVLHIDYALYGSTGKKIKDTDGKTGTIFYELPQPQKEPTIQEIRIKELLQKGKSMTDPEFMELLRLERGF